MNKPNVLGIQSSVPAAGCVLAGGKSRRMGVDKALLKLNGKYLISIALERFYGLPELLISAADMELYAFTGARTIPDERPGMGPLGGFISVLKAAESDFVCFRPVDTPFVPAALHTMLAAACQEKNAAVPICGGAIEPLLACFAKTALSVLENLAGAGNFKAADAFPLLNTAYIPIDAPEIQENLGDPTVYLINANDPESFAKLSDFHFP